jgi:hypothetical protein
MAAAEFTPRGRWVHQSPWTKSGLSSKPIWNIAEDKQKATWAPVEAIVQIRLGASPK